MENQNTQTAQVPATSSSNTAQINEQFTDGGLIVVMTDSFGVTGGTDGNEEQTGTTQA